MTYGPSTIRYRRTKGAVAQLDTQILEVLAADHPQSIRHVFYRLTDPRLEEPVEKSDKGYRTVQRRITQMRREGRLPYGWITDATRRGYHVNTYNAASDFLRDMAQLYRADLWRDADRYVEVWVESRSIAGVVEGVCEDLAVSLYPAGGFSSITLAYQAAEHIRWATRDGRKPALVLFIGDYDKAGVLIDKSLECELRDHLGVRVDLSFKRVGITAQQIAEFNLPTKPAKSSDRRSAHITTAVEAEAMPAEILRKMLRTHIERELPQHALAVARVAETSEQAHLKRIAELLDGGAI